MNWNEFLRKFALTCKYLMEAPIDSPEREEWIKIKREMEQKRAIALTIATN